MGQVSMEARSPDVKPHPHALLSAKNIGRRLQDRWIWQNIRWNSLLSILAASAFVTGLLTEGIIRIHPWYAPQ